MMSNNPIPLSSLSLSPNILATLNQANFQYVHDIISLNASQLSKELHIPIQEAYNIIRLAKESHNRGGQRNGTQRITSSTVPQIEENYARISLSTGSKHFDELFGGNGIFSGGLVEICGTYGVGKTTFLMQCAAMATMPKECGGLASKVLYIDTEGAFSKLKMTALVRSLKEKLKKERPKNSSLELPSEDEILSNIRYYRATDLYEFLACMSLLEASIEMDGYSLVIIDSITDHFRHTIEGTDRSKVLYSIADQLKSISRRRACCVVVSNQVRTQIEPGRQSRLVPSLGDKWAHAISCRVMMFKKDDMFIAQLYKSVNAQQQIKGYIIDPQSSLICDAEYQGGTEMDRVMNAPVTISNGTSSTTTQLGRKRTLDEVYQTS